MVRFTVDSFPDDTFEGIVTQVRKQPTTEQNVVAYTVIAEADNPQRKLLPGMTANADIIIDTKRNVLKVPAAALRWTPASENASRNTGGPVMIGGPGFGPPGGGGGSRQGAQRGGMGGRIVEQLDLDARQRAVWDPIAAELRQKSAAAFAAAGGDRKAIREAMRKNMDEAFTRLEPVLRPDQKTKLTALRAAMAQGGGRAGGMRGGTVYVMGKDDKPQPIPVRVGASDGNMTEIVSSQLKPGAQVITGGGPRPKAQPRGGFGPPGAGPRGG
jgi:HlyD family secretion protein